CASANAHLHSFPTRRSSDLVFMRTISRKGLGSVIPDSLREKFNNPIVFKPVTGDPAHGFEGTAFIELCDAIWEARKQGKLTKRRSEEHTSELQSPYDLVCRL